MLLIISFIDYEKYKKLLERTITKHFIKFLELCPKIVVVNNLCLSKKDPLSNVFDFVFCSFIGRGYSQLGALYLAFRCSLSVHSRHCLSRHHRFGNLVV